MTLFLQIWEEFIMKKRTAGVILAAALIFLCSGLFAHAKTANNLVTNGGTLIVEAEDLKFDETVYKLVTGDETFMSGGAAIGMNTVTPEIRQISRLTHRHT